MFQSGIKNNVLVVEEKTEGKEDSNENLEANPPQGLQGEKVHADEGEEGSGDRYGGFCSIL